MTDTRGIRHQGQSGYRLLSHVARVAEGVSTGLWPDTEAVGLLADGNAVRELAGAGIEDVHLLAVPPTHPQLPAIGGDVAHVRAAAMRDRPVGHDLARDRIDDADRSGAVRTRLERVPAAVGDVEEATVA